MDASNAAAIDHRPFHQVNRPTLTSSVMRTLVRSERDAGRSPIRVSRSCCRPRRNIIRAPSSRRPFRPPPRLSEGVSLLLLLLAPVGLLNRTRSRPCDVPASRPAAALARSIVARCACARVPLANGGGRTVERRSEDGPPVLIDASCWGSVRDSIDRSACRLMHGWWVQFDTESIEDGWD